MTNEESQAAFMREQEKKRREEQREAEERQRLHMQQMQAQQMRKQQASQGQQGMNGGVNPQMMTGGGEQAPVESAAGSTAASITPMILAGLAYEGNARKKGRRPNSKSAHIRDTVTGRNMTRDVEKLGDKLGGPGEEMMDLLGKVGKPWEWF